MVPGRIGEREYEASQLATERAYISFDREVKPGTVTVFTWPLSLGANSNSTGERRGRGGCFAFEFVRDGVVLCRSKLLTGGTQFEMKSKL